MKTISITNISITALENVYQIYAKLEGNNIAAIASKSPNIYVTGLGGKPIPESISIALVRQDSSDFSSIQEARQALQDKPIRKILNDLNFTTKPSEDAQAFMKSLMEFTGGNYNPIDRASVERIGQTAGLNSEQLISVLIELDDKTIHSHDSGMISQIPDPMA